LKGGAVKPTFSKTNYGGKIKQIDLKTVTLCENKEEREKRNAFKGVFCASHSDLLSIM
jgi:hypothetical protein